MLQPFRISNLHTDENEHRDARSKVIRVTAPTYDATVTDNPSASLKYTDEEGDRVTVGTSLELEQRLSESLNGVDRSQRPATTTTTVTPREDLNKNRSMAGPLDHVNNLHEFDIESREDVQAIWQKLQKDSTFESRDEVSASPPDHQGRTLPTKTSRRSLLEDYRRHHFNSTNPPQVLQMDADLGKPTAAIPIEPGTSNSAISLTVEGKRQAQSAGDRLRARGAPSRPRLITTLPQDRSGHHNRWASYKAGSTPRGFSGLAEASALLRKPITHRDSPDSAAFSTRPQNPASSKAIQVTSALDASNSIDEKADMTCTGAGAASKTHDGWKKTPKDIRNSYQEQNHKNIPANSIPIAQGPSLLEVFEAELAKKSTEASTEEWKQPQLQSPQMKEKLNVDSANNQPWHHAQAYPNAGQERSKFVTFARSENESSSANITSTARRDEKPSNATESGIKQAVDGFEICLRGIVDAVQAAQPSPELGTQLADSITQAFKTFASGFTIKKDISTNGEAKGISDAKDAFPMPGHQQDVLSTETSTTPRINSSIPSQPNLEYLNDQKSHEENAADESHSRQASPKRKQLRFAEERKLRNTSSLSSLHGLNHHYHPSPSNNYQPRSQIRTRVPLTSEFGPFRRFNSAGHSRRPKKTENVEEQSEDLRGSKVLDHESKAFPAVTDRFPTLAQFERSNFQQASAHPTLLDLEEKPIQYPTLAADSSRASNPSPSHMSKIAQTAAAMSSNGPSGNGNENPRSAGVNEDLKMPNSTLAMRNFQRLPHESQRKSFDVFRQNMIAMRNSALDQSAAFGTPSFDNPNGRAAPLRAPPFSQAPDQDIGGSSHNVSNGPVSRATLNQPFDAFGNDLFTRQQSTDGVRRTATLADLRGASSRLRRPYSEHFSGTGRLSWENFADKPTYRENEGPNSIHVPVNRSTSSSVERRPHTSHRTPRPEENPNQTVENQERISPINPNNPTLSSRVQECFNQLLQLGFDGMDQKRLLMYAEATSGDLHESLDMISEDQRAQQNNL